jgi:hypothetical protein
MNSFSVKLVARPVHRRPDKDHLLLHCIPPHRADEKLVRNCRVWPLIFRFPTPTTPTEPLPAMEKRKPSATAARLNPPQLDVPPPLTDGSWTWWCREGSGVGVLYHRTVNFYRSCVEIGVTPQVFN